MSPFQVQTGIRFFFECLSLFPISDWFAPGAGEIDEEVNHFRRVLPSGGIVMWRSAAKYPWYNAAFERAGFIVIPLGIRTGPYEAIDGVNM